ncbi:MAG TPA: DNA replication and repair protein RecF [Chitinophagaceae bacterium]|jgi:DNA replication and repair protein RecF|nr:DNA replication and repair protein RecF [Chitinophagaceae bacterium]
MLKVDNISLFQFKNYSNQSFAFPSRITGIFGNNGVGKTNLLDAVYYLCFTKSYFTRSDSMNVQHGKKGFRLEAAVHLANQHEKVVCILRETGKKEFSINDEPYDKFSRHIGRYPCVVIAPDDIQVITDGSEERRKWLDTLLSQVDSEYLQQLITYNKILQQRNSLLKSFAETGRRDFSLLTVLDEQLVKPGDYIFTKRKEFLVAFLPQVKQLYLAIARQEEPITLYYDSELLHTSLAELLAYNRQKDCAVQRTTSGIHRDDLEFMLGADAFKNIASQGQRKSLLFALKLAELDTLKKEKGFPPLLLLDDVFEKLDEDRITSLLAKVCVENEGQVFITDTHGDRLRHHLEALQLPFQLIGL